MSMLLDITSIIFSLIGTLLYPLFGIIFVIMDTVQNIFYGFAGISPVRFGSSTTWGGGQITNTGSATDANGNYLDTDNGIIYYLFRTDTAKNILISMAILGVFLLIIFTVMAFIRNMYQAKQKKWQEIISSSIKGLINFLFLPICCLLGALAGNVLLQALNDATANSSNVSFSRMLFVASAYQANVFRSGDDPAGVNAYIRLYELYRDSEGFSESTITAVAGSGGQEVMINGVSYGRYDSEKDGTYADLLDNVYRSSDSDAWIWPYPNVNNYNLWEINYLLLGVGGVFILFVLFKICFGAVKRLFMLLILFVISPAICSLYPLDDGSAVGKWRSEFIKQFFSVYGTVIGLNLFFALVPLLNSINFGWADTIGIVPLLITIAGLYMINDFINLISSLIPGAGNALSEGSSLAGQVKGGFKKGAKVAVGTGLAVTGAFVRASSYANDRRKGIQDYKEKHYDEYKGKRDSATKEAVKKFEEDNASKVNPLRKGTKEYNRALNRVQRNARKDVDKEFTANAREEVGGSATGGFLRSMGGDILQGTGHIVTNLSDNYGLGKPSDWASSIRGSNKSGHDRYKTETDSKKIMSDMKSADNLESVVKTIGGKNGDVLFDKIKDKDEFKNAAKAAGINDLSSRDAFLTQARAQVRVKKDAVAADEAQQKYYDAFDPDKIAERLEKAFDAALKHQNDEGKSVSNWDRTEALERLNRGEKLTYGDGAQSADIELANIMNAELDSVYNNQRQSKGQLEVLTTRALESAKTVSENTTDPELSESLNEYMGSLQDVLSRLDNGQEIHNMGDKLSEKLQKLLEKQENLSKVIKQTSANEGKEISKAIKDAAKNKDKK